MSRTDCPSPETLAAYTLGDLPEAELGAVAQHLEICTECEEQAGRLDGMADAVVAELRQLPNPYIDTDEPDTEHAGSGEIPALPEAVESWGEFSIVREIGRGGMGVVCEAYQGSLNRHVALKFLPEQGDLARFRREARAAGRLHHTNIVPVFGVGAQNGRHFYVMQYIVGRGLGAVLKERAGSGGPTARFDDREAARIGLQVAEALAYAHAQGVIHRDIKPSNLLLDDHGTVWVTDFGLAHDATDTVTMTGTGDFLGTLRYMAPERLSGRGDERADIYGLGVTLYELVCGRPAYAEGDRSVLVHQILHQNPPRPRQIHPPIARDLETIVVKAMEHEPAQRYATAEALAEDLRRFLEDRTIRARRVGTWELAWRWSRRNRIVAGLLAAVFALLATVAMVAAVGYVQTTRALSREELQSAAAIAAEARAVLEARRAGAAEKEKQNQWYAATINLMQPAWDTGQAERLRALLMETREHPGRGFEWYFWQRLCHLEQHIFIGHRGWVRSVAWSPDGRRLATASWDGSGRIWDVVTGKELTILKGHASALWSVAWSPDGQRLATGSLDGTAKIWRASDGRELLTLSGHTGQVYSVAWAPKGERLATGSWDGTTRIWDSDDGHERLAIKESIGYAKPVAWSPNGKRLATGSWDGKVTVWDTTTGRESLTLKGHKSGVTSLAWSPNGARLASASEEGRVILWDLSTGQQLLSLRGHTGQIYAVAWSADGARLTTGSYDGTARVWDASSGGQKLIFKGHTGWVNSVAWSPDRQWLATGSDDGTAKVWLASSTRESIALKGHDAVLRSIAWSPDQRFLATASGDKTARIWDAVDGRQRLVLSGHSQPVTSVCWSPDGVRLATGSADSTVKIWPASGAGDPLTLNGHKTPVSAIAWSPDGRFLATAGRDATARVWDVLNGRERLTLGGHSQAVESVCWSPDGTRLATASRDGRARVWDARDGNGLLTLNRHGSPVRAVAFSPDGHRLATGSGDGRARVWEAEGGRLQRTLEKHAGEVNAVCWSPDGMRLLTGGRDGMVRVWDAQTGSELLTIKAHTGPVNSVAWSPDGRRLAVASQDYTATIWDSVDDKTARDWARQDTLVRDLLAANVFDGPQARGFIRDWLLLLPVPFVPTETGLDALQRQQLPDEANLRPLAGEPDPNSGGRRVWRKYHSPEQLVDFNEVLGRVGARCVAYAVCYLESDRARDGLWLQVASDDEAAAFLNGREVYRCRMLRPMEALDTAGPVSLKRGTNVLVIKVVNESKEWQCCVRLLDDAGQQPDGIRAKLVP